MGITRTPTITTPETAGFVVKSGQVLDLDAVRGHLLALKPAAQTRIRSLDETQRRLYNYIVSHVQKHHDDPAAMEQLQRLFQEVYGDITNPEPGTLASYFVGCSNQPILGFAPKNCGLHCAASLTNLAQGESPCDARVILALPNGTNMTFVSISSTLSEDAIVYLTQPQVRGFNQAEIEELARLNVSRVMLVYYDTKTQSYKQVQDWTELNKLPQRVDVIPSEVAANRNPNAVFFILLLVLFLIVIYIGWRIYNSR